MKRTFIAIALLVAAVPVHAAKVYVDFDDKVDFSKFSTYALVEGTPAGELTQPKIDAALRAQLEAEGLKEVEKGEADLHISTHASSTTQKKQKGGNVNLGIGKSGKRGHVGVSTGGRSRIKNVEEGSLIVDLVDAESEQLVWQATGSGTIKGDPQKIEAKMKKALEDAFKKYPPKKK